MYRLIYMYVQLNVYSLLCIISCILHRNMHTSAFPQKTIGIKLIFGVKMPIQRIHVATLLLVILFAFSTVPFRVGVDNMAPRSEDNKAKRPTNGCEVKTFDPPTEVRFPPISSKRRIDRYDGCLRYECSRHNTSTCTDETLFADTNYDDPEQPPCYTHILRDMIQVVDTIMCDLELEYFAAYGTLLGMIRNNHVIPWTADNDVVVSFRVAEELYKNRVYIEEKYGLRVFNDFYLRGCLTDKFKNGKLSKWNTTKYDESIKKSGNKGDWVAHFPYVDFFYAEINPETGKFTDERACEYNQDEYFPPKRIPVYNHSFYINVPQEPVTVLESVFGRSWKIPDSSGNTAHGLSNCDGNSPLFRKWKRTGKNPKWEKLWNQLLLSNEIK